MGYTAPHTASVAAPLCIINFKDCYEQLLDWSCGLSGLTPVSIPRLFPPASNRSCFYSIFTGFVPIPIFTASVSSNHITTACYPTIKKTLDLQTIVFSKEKGLSAPARINTLAWSDFSSIVIGIDIAVGFFIFEEL